MVLKNKPYSILLWIVLGLFCARVSGQLIQFFFSFSFLPSFEEFHSGTMSYVRLFFFQVVIILFYLRTCIRMSRGTIVVNRIKGKRLLILGIMYASVMITRYILRMAMFPTERWFGGCIPIFFHIVLASFFIINGIYHIRADDELDRKSTRAFKIVWAVSSKLLTLFIFLWLFYQCVPTIVAKKAGMRKSMYSVSIEKKVPIPMDDGKILCADVYRPERLSPAPTILIRVPLDNNFKGKTMSNVLGRMWAERGYNVVIQGVRGRFFSEGKHIPFKGERADGIATLKWLNTQTWHNGKVGMWGGSYFGYTQWEISDQDSLGFSAMLTQISSSSNYAMFYPNGVFAFKSALFWAIRAHSNVDTPKESGQLAAGFQDAPMIKADDRTVGDIPFYNDWASHTRPDNYWLSVDGKDRAKKLDIPILMMAGWYDPYLSSEVQDFEDITQGPHKECKLIIGPWCHAETVVMPNGYKDQNYRLASIAPSIDWYDKHLKGLTVKDTPPVKLFVMGINEWRYENEFPLKRTKYTTYYLSANKYSSSPKADILDTVLKDTESVSTYRYDPQTPVPSLGGAVLGDNAGALNQEKIESRGDVLIFTTAVLKSDVEVTGKIKLILNVSSDAKNTDFVAKLTDVYPDGTSFNISEGIVRGSYEGKDVVKNISIELNPTSNVFLKGHKIRLEIMSSNYPRYSLNYNTGGNNYDETTGIVAEQKIYSGKLFPSQLILPVIPR